MNERIDIVVFVFFVAFAATIACASFPATRAAGVRRSAETRLRLCRKGLSAPDQYRACYTETQRFCMQQGLERTCGEGFQ